MRASFYVRNVKDFPRGTALGSGVLIKIYEVDCRRKGFARCANAHLSDDETVAKMGHPVSWLV